MTEIISQEAQTAEIKSDLDYQRENAKRISEYYQANKHVTDEYKRRKAEERKKLHKNGLEPNKRRRVRTPNQKPEQNSNYTSVNRKPNQNRASANSKSQAQAIVQQLAHTDNSIVKAQKPTIRIGNIEHSPNSLFKPAQAKNLGK